MSGKNRQARLRLDTCAALDSSGRKCPKPAAGNFNYHGEPEIYDGFDGRPTWVRVRLCEKHAENMPKAGAR
jgi:hypothetical protein